jgi:hypothetical protein
MVDVIALEPLTAADLGLPPPHALSAAIPLAVAAVLMWQRWAPRAVACLALVAGAALTSGWVYGGIRAILGGATWLVDWVTRSTVGGVAPGIVALALLLYFVLQLRPDAELAGKLSRLRNPRVLAYAGAGGRRTPLRTRTRRWGPGWLPAKLGAFLAGLALPSTAASVPGVVGVAVISTVNVVGGAIGWVLAAAWGVL